MKFTDHLVARAVLLDLDVPDRDSCLRALVDALAAAGALTETADPLARLIAREDVMSTGIHPGVAVPHAATAAAARPVCALARTARGVDFRSLDGGAVRLVFCLLGPPEAADTHVRLLGRLARLIECPGLIDDLLAAGTPDSLIALLRAAERRGERGPER